MFAAAIRDIVTLSAAIKMELKFRAISNVSINGYEMTQSLPHPSIDPVPLYLAAAVLACGSKDIDDQRLARDLYLRAAENGHIEALWCAGTMLLNGEGGAKDETSALLLIEHAARLKSLDARLFLADSLELGSYGLTRNTKRARLFRIRSEKTGQLEIASRVAKPSLAVLQSVQRAKRS